MSGISLLRKYCIVHTVFRHLLSFKANKHRKVSMSENKFFDRKRGEFRQPTAHVHQNIFAKTPIEVCSSHLYASFGTFYAKIGQLFEAQ